jgi:hypothetical protein
MDPTTAAPSLSHLKTSFTRNANTSPQISNMGLKSTIFTVALAAVSGANALPQGGSSGGNGGPLAVVKAYDAGGCTGNSVVSSNRPSLHCYITLIVVQLVTTGSKRCQKEVLTC